MCIRDSPATTRKAWLERKNAYYVALLGRLTSADLLPGAQALVTACREAGMATAIASASRNTPTVLAGLGIAELFDAVVDGNSVVRSKPEPDVFLAAAERLGVPAGQCVVLEDAEAGVVGALPVSYTHLDVYKRQAPHRSARGHGPALPAPDR